MENILPTNKKPTEETEEMTIKIQTLDNIYPLTIKRSSNVTELKELISDNLSVPVNKQRLIFQGKLLQASEKLKTYKIAEDSVVHLVAKTLDESQPENNNNFNTNNNTSNSEQRVNIEDMFSGIFEIPIATRARRPRRRRVPRFDISESFESMHQNIATIQNLHHCKNKFDDYQVNMNKTIIPFELNRSKFEVGQWIDVKDTIDQWLEAQVMQVRNNQVYVHYNGWGNRWDEWIDFSSPRIASFKTYSQQSPTGVFLSPYPSIIPDANIEPQHRNIDTFYYMDKAVGFINDITKHIELMNKIRKRNARGLELNNKEMKMSDFEESKSNNLGGSVSTGVSNLNTLTNPINSQHSYTTTTNTSSNNNNINLLNSNDVGPNMLRSQVMNSNTHNHQNNIQVQLTTNDYELLFYCSQLVPIMDRTGRLLSDVSLHLSHLLLNANLYPQLLLGNSQYEGFPDNLSCTSGYSMYTNEGSTVSGLINNQSMTEANIGTSNINSLNTSSSILQNNRGNQSIQNSNQLINNYTSLLQSSMSQARDNQSNTSAIVNNIIQPNINNQSQSQSQVQAQIQSQNQGQSQIQTIQTNQGGQGNSSSNQNQGSSNQGNLQKEVSTSSFHSNNSGSNVIQSNINNQSPIHTQSTSTNNQVSTNQIGQNTQNNPISQVTQSERQTSQNNQERQGGQGTNNQNNNQQNNSLSDINTQQRINDSLPKINLQVPAMMSMAEVALVNGYNYNDTNNIDIYVHTISTPLRTNNQESTNFTSNNQTSSSNQSQPRSHRNYESQSQTQSHSHQTSTSQTNNNQTSTESQNNNTNNSGGSGSIFDNILSLFSQTVSSNRNNSSTSNYQNNSSNNNTGSNQGSLTQTSNNTQNSSNQTQVNSSLSNLINSNNNTNSIRSNLTSSNSGGNNISNNIANNIVSNMQSQTTMTNNDLLLSNNLQPNLNSRLDKNSKETQTDGCGSEENNILSISDAKSDNYKKYYTKSLKSVSDVSDIEQFHDEEDTKSKKLDKNDSKSVKSTTLSKLNELNESYNFDNNSKKDENEDKPDDNIK